MNVFQRSWTITKMSMSVITEDKELLAFPILSGVFSAIFFVAMLAPFVLSIFIDQTAMAGTVFYLLVFLTYLGLAFIATFFNVCVVYTAKTRFKGKNATFFETLGFAVQRIHLILAWSLVSATVGLILRLIDDAADRMQGIGRLIVEFLVSLMGAAWSVLTLFVVPVMVYDNVGPFKAISKSAHALKKTWGESLVRMVGTGILQFIGVIVGAIATVGLLILYWPVGLVFGVLYFIGLFVFFSLVNTIFNTALYEYAATGKLPKGFDHEMAKGAFASRKRAQ